MLFATLDGLQRPSLDAMVPMLVSPDKLAATASIMSIRSQIGMVAAPALTGVSALGRSMIWNQSIPDALRGRLAGLEMLSYSSGPSLGNVESGILERLVGLRTSIVAGGSLCVVATALLSLMLPTFWRYDAREGEKLRQVPEEAAFTSDATAHDPAVVSDTLRVRPKSGTGKGLI